MIKKMAVHWHLRLRMAEKGFFATSDLVAPLSERGVKLSREQIYRLVTTTPQRLSMDVLAALCDILDCGPADLIEVVEVREQVHKTPGGAVSPTHGTPDVQRSRIRRPGGSGP